MFVVFRGGYLLIVREYMSRSILGNGLLLILSAVSVRLLISGPEPVSEEE
jgi:hypothetical protein